MVKEKTVRPGNGDGSERRRQPGSPRRLLIAISFSFSSHVLSLVAWEKLTKGKTKEEEGEWGNREVSEDTLGNWKDILAGKDGRWEIAMAPGRTPW